MSQSETAEVLRAFRFALDPTPRQRIQLLRYAGAARWAYNYGIAEITGAHRAWRRRLAELTAAGHSETDARHQLHAQARRQHAQQKDLDARKKGLREETRQATDEKKIELRMELAQAQADSTAMARTLFDTGMASPTAFDLAAQWRTIRDRPGEDGGSPWWREIDYYVFLTAFANAHTAWKNFTESRSGKRPGPPVGYPRFAKKGRTRDRFTILSKPAKPAVRIESDACNHHHTPRRGTAVTSRYRGLTIGKLGNLRLHSSGKRLARAVRDGRAVIKSVTVSRHGDRWYASVLCRMHQPQRARPTKRQTANGTVGVKWNTKTITLHHGDSYTIIPQPRYLDRALRRLSSHRRTASRRTSGSARRAKAELAGARLHHRTAERRAGWLHQLTAHLTRTYATIAIEDLHIASLIRRDQPRSRSRRRNRAITDTAPGELRRQLTYKTSWYGSQLALTEHGLPTTRTCAACGGQNPRPTPPGQDFRCETCQTVTPRTHNAAAVITRYATVPD